MDEQGLKNNTFAIECKPKQSPNTVFTKHICLLETWWTEKVHYDFHKAIGYLLYCPGFVDKGSTPDTYPDGSASPVGKFTSPF